MTKAERDRLVVALGEDLESSLLGDRKFRASFCAEYFVKMTDEELKQSALDAGLEDHDA